MYSAVFVLEYLISAFHVNFEIFIKFINSINYGSAYRDAFLLAYFFLVSEKCMQL